MNIRKAEKKDINGINCLLSQVLTIHHEGRPDLFKGDTKKYTDQQLLEMIYDDTNSIFCAVDENDNVLGYAFCIFQQHLNDNILTDIKTLYIDDLCVDKNLRGQHIGKSLLDYVVQYAKSINCYNVTLNVWSCNPDAIKFYEQCGLKPQKIGMETIL